MKIIVCVKQVPSTEAKISLKDGAIDETNFEWIVNPYDEFATEEAIRIKEKLSDTTIDVISLGPKRAEKAIKSVLALGIDNGFHLVDDAYQSGDVYAAAKTIKASCEKMGFDLIMCGKQAVDNDNHQFGALLAEMLNVPHVSAVNKVDIADDQKSATIKRDVEGGSETFEVQFPCVLTAEKGLNEPRYAKLKDIMKVKRKKLTNWKPDEIGLSADDVGAAGSMTELVSLEMPPERTAGRIIEGETPVAVKELAKLLREEAKVI